MLYDKVKFDEKDENAFLEVFVSEKVEGFVRKAILVIPGGAYSSVCASREGEPIAQAFVPYGYNAFVLHYTVNEKPFPSHLVQASKAIKHIKDNADKYNIDPENIFVVGFSAGGHLAATLGTMWHKEEIYKEIDMPLGYNKPKGMMLIYPVITGKYYNARSFENLLMKEKLTEEDIILTSAASAVSDKTSPAYIIHTSNDEMVDVRHSISMANALAENDIRFEMHIYPDAPHGVALGNEITKCGVDKWCNSAISEWVNNAVVWANSL